MTARPYWKAASVGSRRPSPGRSCTLTVVTSYDDGSDPETYTLVWDGYTASEARTLCVARLREAGHKIHAGCDGSILQSFPPDYPWHGTKTSQQRQVGNAVPPLMAAHILAALCGLEVPA